MRSALALVATGSVLAAPPSFGKPRYQPRRLPLSAILRLTPTHRSASVSRSFGDASSGIDSLRLVLPRGLHLELLIRNPVEVASAQPASKMLCTPYRLCRDPGRTGLRLCHDSRRRTICAYTTDGGPAFQPGRWVLTLRELAPRRARVALRVVFIAGPP